MAMEATINSDALLDRLPAVRGRYEVNADLSGRAWFRTGGPAEVLFEPEDAEDLQLFLAERSCDVPITVIGFGSNLLVRDGGIDGVVVVLGDAFTNVAFDGTSGAMAASIAASSFRHSLPCSARFCFQNWKCTSTSMDIIESVSP